MMRPELTTRLSAKESCRTNWNLNEVLSGKAPCVLEVQPRHPTGGAVPILIFKWVFPEKKMN
jgi:hypothetical protein